MKKILFKIFAFIAFVVCVIDVKGQDPHFTQFAYTPLHINPAYTGVFDGLFRLSNSYRTQWSGLGKGYQTLQLSADAPLGKPVLKSKFFGVGLMIYQDKAGEAGFKSTIIEGSLSFTAAIDDQGDNFFSMGFQGGLNQQSIDINKATWDSQWNGDQFDPSSASHEAIQLQQLNYLDLNAGLMYYYVPDGLTSFNIGASMQHIGGPNVSVFTTQDAPLKERLNIHSSADITVNDDKSAWVLPKVLYMIQGTQKELMIGGYFKNKVRFKSLYTNYQKEAYFYGGLFYRWADAYILSARFEYNSVSLGLSYDINSSSLATLAGSANAFEVNFAYVTYVKRGTRAKNYNKMPRFF